MNTLPTELHREITSNLPLSSILPLNKYYYNLERERYCNSFAILTEEKPSGLTQTQILSYTNPHVLIRSYTKNYLGYDETMKIYAFTINRPHKKGDNKTIVLEYDDFENTLYYKGEIFNTYYYNIKYLFQYPSADIDEEVIDVYDLDLNAIYTIYKYLCPDLAISLTLNKLNSIHNIVSSPVTFNLLQYGYVYLFTSALMLNLVPYDDLLISKSVTYQTMYDEFDDLYAILYNYFENINI